MLIQPVILSGGSGTRLWPLSREHYPKQLLPLYGQETLLQQTALRLEGLKDANPPIVVCNEEHRFLIAEQLREIGIQPKALILEPVGRNTAPALTLASLSLPEEHRKAVLLVMPADHIIRDQDAFLAAVSVGHGLADQGYLTTFGIVPTSPETGYGYIRCGENGCVEAFVEKPDLQTAEQYLKNGGYLWNSGMFMLRADLWLSELDKHAPAIRESCEQAIRDGRQDGDFKRVGRDSFIACPADSIDYAVMEKTDRAMVVPLEAGWSDIGAWSAIWNISDRDSAGNVIRGDVLLEDTEGSYVLSQHRLVATVGVKDLIVAETADAVLVAHKDKAQEVKAVVQQLKKQQRMESLMHRRVYRPWGSFEGLDVGERFQVKRLVIKPGASISLQLHHHRAEHWVVVKGTARVTRGDEVVLLSENESTYIPVGMKHRLENPGYIPLEIIEVQSGGYLGEDDIVRFEDNYDRHKS